MRKIGLFLVITLTAVSCEIQQPNGPKVSDESLKDELETLTEFATFEPMRALSLILELGDNVIGNTDLRIGLFTHTDTNTWELMAAWDEGGSGIEAHRKATSPICFTKREDGSSMKEIQPLSLTAHGKRMKTSAPLLSLRLPLSAVLLL